MSFLELVKPNIIKTPLQSKTKEGIIKELLQLLIDAGKVTDFESTYNAILQRESQISTGLADGIAIPHAKTKTVDSLTLAIGILPEGIDFNALDGQLSYIFFMLLAPPDEAALHMKALSEIAKLVQTKDLCKLLINAKNAQEIAEILQGKGAF